MEEILKSSLLEYEKSSFLVDLYSFLAGLRFQNCLERVMPIGTNNNNFANQFRIGMIDHKPSAKYIKSGRVLKGTWGLRN